MKDTFGISKDENRNNERQEVWDMRWASDNPHYLAIMERDRMYVLKDGIPEEPINSSAYIAEFEVLFLRELFFSIIICHQCNNYEKSLIFPES